MESVQYYRLIYLIQHYFLGKVVWGNKDLSLLNEEKFFFVQVHHFLLKRWKQI